MVVVEVLTMGGVAETAVGEEVRGLGLVFRTCANDKIREQNPFPVGPQVALIRK